MHEDASKPIQPLIHFFERSVEAHPDNIALICDSVCLTYLELEKRANQLANHLIQLGAKEGNTIGLFLPRSIDSYISILAILKTGAAYVPIDVDYPDERVNYILKDAALHSVITYASEYKKRSAVSFPKSILLDQLDLEANQDASTRPTIQPIAPASRCYIIYTSGSTGQPKGVEITQRNIFHYVSTASQLYQMTPEDRVYQGFSLGFDASLEELWMAFANGAALVACTDKDTRSGVGLIDFLNTLEVTVFSTVPTLLSTLEGPLPHLRLLILGGEACSASVIKPWLSPQLRVLNTYGPTEATVIATHAECLPNQPITIGKPLPGYQVLILDEQLHPVTNGKPGELCIGGPAIAKGYLNQPEMTANKFIPHPDDAHQQLYRSGDLALINAEGNIEYLGRIDDQIKLRGFRIELNEIENIIMQYDGLNQAIVALQDLHRPTLVAYLHLKNKALFDLDAFHQFLESNLPNYMLPGHVEFVDHFPLLPSGKVNRKALPKPSLTHIASTIIPPKTALEINIATIWENALQQKPISIDDDFFYDLGGHSLTAANVVSNLRKITAIETISILDIYQNPTIRKLADKFENQMESETEAPPPTERNKISTTTHFLCGVGQFFGTLFQYAIGSWQLFAVVLSYAWLSTRTSILSMSAMLFLLIVFLGLPVASMIITICAKWMLVGRIKPGRYKLWGWFYCRWWLVERLQKNIFSPEHLIGSPLISLYYRLLGAKIGKNVYIATANLAVQDMITIGDDCSIGLDARLIGYHVENGWLTIGPITLGNNCFVGARSVLSINTTMMNNSGLDDMSMLPSEQQIPANQFYSGSPARPSLPSPEHIFNQHTARVTSSGLVKFGFGLLHYLFLTGTLVLYYLCYVPTLLLLAYVHEQTHFLFTLTVIAPTGALLSLCLYYLSISLIKKCLMNRIKPGIYSLNSLYYLRHWTIGKLLDVNEIRVMADTLYFPYLLRFLGANIGARVEMGETPHIIPDLITIHDEGFTASAVGLAWPSVHHGLIQFAPVEIGKRGFVGNDSLLPLGTNIGEGGLLGCMTITPPDNQAAGHHTAWLGSPAVFLPTREQFPEFSEMDKFTPPKRLVRTRLLIEFFRIILPTTFNLISLFSLLYLMQIMMNEYSLITTAMLLPIASLLISSGLVAVVIALKWFMLGKIPPTTKPIWNPFIWKNDVFCNLFHYFVSEHFTHLIIGTPFVSMLFRAFGAKIGKKVFIDTDDFTEFDLIHIGDDACLNSEAVIQTHLYEDRIFKVAPIDIKKGCNIGIASIILYNTTMEENATLGNFSLLMKGETLPANTRWQGIPAQPMRVKKNRELQPPSNTINQTTLIIEPG